jgi:hypothetical protein
MFVTCEVRVFNIHTFLANFREWLEHRGRPVGCLSLGRRQSVVQVLCVIEQTAQNCTDSLPRRTDREGQQAIFSIRPFQTDLYFHGDTVHIGTGYPNC